MGTAAWPGDALTSSEIIAGRKFYKYEVAASAIWGQTINDMYIVNTDSWDTSESTGDFSSYVDEYFFEATKSTTLVQLASRPSEPSISIDGTFDDWADLSGNTESSSTGNATLLKAYTDGTDLFIYYKMTPGDGVTFDVSGWRYNRIYFDTDNDATTGWDTSHWLYAGADNILYGENGGQQCLLVYHSKGGVANAAIEGISTSGSYELESVSNSDGTIEVEMSFPLTELGTITGDEVKMYTSGSVASSQSVYGNVSFMIP